MSANRSYLVKTHRTWSSGTDRDQLALWGSIIAPPARQHSKITEQNDATLSHTREPWSRGGRAHGQARSREVLLSIGTPIELIRRSLNACRHRTRARTRTHACGDAHRRARSAGTARSNECARPYSNASSVPWISDITGHHHAVPSWLITVH